MAIDLQAQFTLALFEAYQRAKVEAKYHATIFYGMLNKDGGLLTAKYLINSNKPSDGYTELYDRKRLDLTVEAVVIENPKWQVLFTQEELERAKKRLADYHYVPRIAS